VAKFSSKDCILLIDGYNVMGVNTELTHTKEAGTEESTAFGDTWQAHLAVGINRAETTQEGFYDDAAASINAALNEQQGVARIMSAGFEGNTMGKAFVGHAGNLQINYNRIASVNSLHRVNASYLSSGVVDEGLILLPLTVLTADGNTASTPVDGGAATDYGGAAYLHVTNVEDCDDIVVKVRDSADGLAFADLLTFTAVAPTRGAERLTVAAGVGSVRRYLAASWAFTNPGAAPSATVLVGFARYTS